MTNNIPLKWSLQQHGDMAEQMAWVKIKDKFPNYEVFWSRFIVPMTCRESVPPGHPLWIHFRKDVEPSLQHVAMSHYTIFRSLIFIDEVIYRQNTGDVLAALPFTFNERVDNAYIYLGIVIDMIENLFFGVSKIKEQLLGIKVSEKLDPAEIMQKATDYVANPSRYEKDYKAFVDKKRPVSIKLHDMNNFLMIKDQELRNSFKKFCDDIRGYRNAVIHNPQMGTTHDSNGVTWTPKKDKLGKYILWGHLFYYKDDSDFVKAQDAMIEDFGTMCKYLDQTWNHLIEEYQRLVDLPAYQSLLGTLPIMEKFYTPDDSIPPGGLPSASARRSTSSSSGSQSSTSSSSRE